MGVLLFTHKLESPMLRKDSYQKRPGRPGSHSPLPCGRYTWDTCTGILTWLPFLMLFTMF